MKIMKVYQQELLSLHKVFPMFLQQDSQESQILPLKSLELLKHNLTIKEIQIELLYQLPDAAAAAASKDDVFEHQRFGLQRPLKTASRRSMND